MALDIYSKIPIYPIFYLLKEDYMYAVFNDIHRPPSRAAQYVAYRIRAII